MNYDKQTDIITKSFELRRDDNVIKYQFHSFIYPKWKLELKNSEIRKGNKTFKIKTIDKIFFEVQGTTYPRNPYGPALCVSNIYLALKGVEYPKYLLTIAVQEKYILTNESQCYNITLDLVKEISNRYNIPYEYSLNIQTKEKNRAIILIIILPIIIALIFIISNL